MSSNGIVTMRAVAQAAKVVPSTVSKALRGDPSISVERREEIRALAERMGYRPHPMVAALMAQLHSRRRRNDPHHLAWLNLWTRAEEKARGHDSAPALVGARRRARELGYEIEVHHVADAKMSPARLRQILTTRSQWGVIFPPVPESAFHYPFDMDGLTAVTIGTSLRNPATHRVSHNHYQGGMLACRQLRARGFRRIGFALSRWNDERVDGRWRAAYLMEQNDWPKPERLPPLLVAPDELDRFKYWISKYKPDAILASERHVGAWLREIGSQHVRVAWLALESMADDTWGIDYRSEALGATAVEQVIGQIHRNERGTPSIAHTLLIDGVWVER